MKNEGNKFDDVYRSAKDYFSTKPEKILVDFAHLIDTNRPALDVGSGQGRHAHFMAERGATVDAIDPSGEAVRTTGELARKRDLPIHSVQAGIEDFDPRRGSQGDDFRSYGTICLFGLIQLLTWDSIAVLRDRVSAWSETGTVLFVTAWTTQDPSFETCSQRWRSIGKNSFRDDAGNVRTFLEPGEARRLFDGFRAEYHWEGLGPPHQHADGPVERHGKVTAVLVR